MIIKKLQLSTHHVQIAFIEAENKRFEATEFNDSTLLVFLHEALGSIGQWRNFPKLLCNQLGLNGFILERQGHGGSDPLIGQRDANYLHAYAYQELHEILVQIIPVGKKVILVGHSDGGTIALLYASKFPKMVKGIVTMAAHVINEPETKAGIYPAIEAFQNGKLAGLQKFHGNKTETLFYAWAQTWLADFFNDWNITNDIQNIQCPTLAIQGKEDQYGTQIQLELIQQSVPHAQTVLLDFVNHHPHLEKPEEVMELIEKWIRNKP